MNRKDFITSKDYVVANFQLALLDLIENYRKDKGINKTELALELGVTKGYISQLLGASHDHKISKLVELALSCNYMPVLKFIPLDTYIDTDEKDQVYELFPITRPKNITYTDVKMANSDNLEWDTTITPVINIGNYRLFKMQNG